MAEEREARNYQFLWGKGRGLSLREVSEGNKVWLPDSPGQCLISSLWSGERLPTGQAFPISLELCVDKVRFSGCTCRLESTGNTLDTKLGLPIPALSSIPFVTLLEGAPVPLSCAHPLEGRSRSGAGPREGRQLRPWTPVRSGPSVLRGPAPHCSATVPSLRSARRGCFATEGSGRCGPACS